MQCHSQYRRQIALDERGIGRASFFCFRRKACSSIARVTSRLIASGLFVLAPLRLTAYHQQRQSRRPLMSRASAGCKAALQALITDGQTTMRRSSHAFRSEEDAPRHARPGTTTHMRAMTTTPSLASSFLPLDVVAPFPASMGFTSMTRDCQVKCSFLAWSALHKVTP